MGYLGCGYLVDNIVGLGCSERWPSGSFRSQSSSHYWISMQSHWNSFEESLGWHFKLHHRGGLKPLLSGLGLFSTYPLTQDFQRCQSSLTMYDWFHLWTDWRGSWTIRASSSKRTACHCLAKDRPWRSLSISWHRNDPSPPGESSWAAPSTLLLAPDPCTVFSMLVHSSRVLLSFSSLGSCWAWQEPHKRHHIWSFYQEDYQWRKKPAHLLRSAMASPSRPRRCRFPEFQSTLSFRHHQAAEIYRYGRVTAALRSKSWQQYHQSAPTASRPWSLDSFPALQYT